MQASQALELLGGIANRKELLDLVSRHELQRALAEGDVVQLRHGTYAGRSADQALATAASVAGVVSHLSAALLHGWKVKQAPAKPMITVPTTRRRLPEHDALLFRGPLDGQQKITDPVRTVLDCCRVLPYDEALAVADSALRSGKITKQELLTAADAGPRTGRARAVRVLAAATPRAANPFESVLRAIAHDVPGLEVVPQGEIGQWTHPDLVDFRLRIVIEAESFEYHALPEAFAYDVRRFTGLVREGWVVLRFTWDDVMHRPDQVRAVLTDVVCRRQMCPARCLAAG